MKNKYKQYYRMDGPWYECTGPDAAHVRDDQYWIFSKSVNMSIGFKPYMIMKIIAAKIPDIMNDFGSYRGYATFGLKPKITTEIKHMILVKKKFLAAEIIYSWWTEITFRPGKSGYKKTKTHFEETVASAEKR